MFKMNPRTCLILFVLTAALLNDSEAFRFRRFKSRVVNAVRRVGHEVRRVVEPVICPLTCSKVCPGVGSAVGLHPAVTGIGCHAVCRRICKRSIPDLVTSDVRYQVVPMSPDFSHYDLNGDKLLSPEEFASAEKLPLEEVYDIFQSADVDGDQMLDVDEFETAPLIFTSDGADGVNDMIGESTSPKSVNEETTQQ
uniref:Tesein-1 n=1 Tax=Sinohyriopsis cumingii TaxID=165450 RepID=A0A2D1QUA7_SINCU|nr:Tesein-1 [Sinohyriopsis cumingii]